MKELIEKAVKKHGKEKVLAALTTMGMVKQSSANCDAIPCDPGYYFNKTVCACVFDVGR